MYLKNITSNPQFITRRDSYRRSYLKFPLHTNTKIEIEIEIEERANGGRFSLKVYLARHNFTVDTTYVDTGIKTSLVVCINNITSKGLVGTNTTVVRPLYCIYTVNNQRASGLAVPGFLHLPQGLGFEPWEWWFS